MGSKAQPKRKSPLKERETEGRFVATKGRQKNPKYSFQYDLDNYDDVYADYNFIPPTTELNYRTAI